MSDYHDHCTTKPFMFFSIQYVFMIYCLFDTGNQRWSLHAHAQRLIHNPSAVVDKYMLFKNKKVKCRSCCLRTKPSSVSTRVWSPPTSNEQMLPFIPQTSPSCVSMDLDDHPNCSYPLSPIENIRLSEDINLQCKHRKWSRREYTLI